MSEECSHQAAKARRRRPRAVNDMQRRVDRAEALVHMGELSSARQALEGASLAPGTEATLEASRDPQKRPSVPLRPVPDELVHHRPQSTFKLDATQFARNLRSARRGAAGGPSPSNTSNLCWMDLQRFVHVAERLSRAQIPPSVREAIRLGRLTALQKADGGIRGIVLGDIIRRLVARTSGSN